MFSSAAKQFGGIAKHVVKKIIREPLEVVETAVGAGDKGKQQENQAMQAMEQAAPTATQSGGQGGQANNGQQPSGFKTQQDYQKYQQLSGNKDQMEMAVIRKKLAQEWGVETGMERARQEYLQKEQERKQVEEQEEKRNEAMMFEKKKVEDQQVAMAKNQASAEKRMSVAG